MQLPPRVRKLSLADADGRRHDLECLYNNASPRQLGTPGRYEKAMTSSMDYTETDVEATTSSIPGGLPSEADDNLSAFARLARRIPVSSADVGWL